MVSLQGLGALVSGSSTATGVSGAVPSSPFAGVFKGLVTETNDLSAKAQQAVSGLLSGSGVDVHEAMIAMQKSDVAFELAMQVRSKAVGAYQQMMGMQF